MSAPRRLGVGRALIGGQFVDGDVAVADGRIAEVGLPAGTSKQLACSGFVDLQVNGFGGVDFATSDPAGYQRAARALAATGVTSFQPTFITLAWDSYAAALDNATEAAQAVPGMIGVHLEGPFLSPLRHGAHDPAHMTDPSPARIRAVTDRHVVTWVTLAPERDGGLDAVAALVDAGLRVAIGHSDASAEQARAAFDRGARAVTHLFNAQSAMHHRAPGVPGAALDDDRVTVTIIVDGHHLAPETVRLVFGRAAGRVALISDAIAAAGTADTVTALGARSVTVSDGRPRLDDGTLAGSVLTMDRAVRNAVDIGIGLEQALAAGSSVPAAALGLHERGDLAPGKVADVVVLDDGLEVVRTLRDGAEVYAG